MTQQTVSRLLVAFFIIQWGAVLFRCDRFPLTWAPMYSSYKGGAEVRVRVADPDTFLRGFLVTRRDGSTAWVGAEALNVPKWNMYRLYTQRAFKDNPNTHSNGNRNIDPLNRWIRGLEEGEPAFTTEWDWRTFWTLNKTLGHDPDDAEFIVRIQADYVRLYYMLYEQRLDRRTTETTDLRWNEDWRERWG
jgi:hypothetical protein